MTLQSTNSVQRDRYENQGTLTAVGGLAFAAGIAGLICLNVFKVSFGTAILPEIVSGVVLGLGMIILAHQRRLGIVWLLGSVIALSLIRHYSLGESALPYVIGGLCISILLGLVAAYSDYRAVQAYYRRRVKPLAA